jgi:hypothetical protein
MFMLLRVASAVLVSAALISSVPASADQNSTSQPQAQSATAATQKKICREDIQTGSIMPKRTCKTQAEWDALTARSQSNLDDLRDQNRSRDMVGGNR